METKPKVTVSAAISASRVVVAKAMASAAMVSFEVCEEEGRPLTQAQQIDIVLNLMMAYRDSQDELEASLELEADMESRFK